MIQAATTTRSDISIHSLQLNGKNYGVLNFLGSKFVFISDEINGNIETSIDLRNYNIVVLKPIEARKITIVAKSIILLNTLQAETITIDATEKTIIFGNITSLGNATIVTGEPKCCTMDESLKNMMIDAFTAGIQQENIEAMAENMLFLYRAIQDTLQTEEPQTKEQSREELLQFMRFFNIVSTKV